MNIILLEHQLLFSFIINKKIILKNINFEYFSNKGNIKNIFYYKLIIQKNFEFFYYLKVQMC